MMTTAAACLGPKPGYAGPKPRRFYGTLPRAWGEVDTWPQLQNMYLNDNNLTGTLPEVRQRVPCRDAAQISHCARLSGCWLAGLLEPACPRPPEPRLCESCAHIAWVSAVDTCLQKWGQAGAMPRLLQLRVDSNRL